MNDFLQEVTKKAMKELVAKKDQVIFDRIKERVVLAGLVDAPFNLEDEKKRRFPRIGVFRETDGSEHYYWNDGSEEGLHLVTFYIAQDLTNFDFNSPKWSVIFNYR